MTNKVGQAATLTPNQQKAVLSVIQSQSRYPVRDRAIFCLSVFSGLRVGEIAQLTIGDVAERCVKSSNLVVREVVTLIKTKGNKTREAFLAHPTLRATIQTYIDEVVGQDTEDLTKHLFLTKSGKPFSSITLNQLFRRIYDWAGFTNHRSHSGRRTFISNLAEQGIGLEHLRVLAGHSSVQTTSLYVDTNPETLKRISVQAMSDEVCRDIRKQQRM